MLIYQGLHVFVTLAWLGLLLLATYVMLPALLVSLSAIISVNGVTLMLICLLPVPLHVYVMMGTPQFPTPASAPPALLPVSTAVPLVYTYVLSANLMLFSKALHVYALPAISPYQTLLIASSALGCAVHVSLKISA